MWRSSHKALFKWTLNIKSTKCLSHSRASLTALNFKRVKNVNNPKKCNSRGAFICFTRDKTAPLHRNKRKLLKYVDRNTAAKHFIIHVQHIGVFTYKRGIRRSCSLKGFKRNTPSPGGWKADMYLQRIGKSYILLEIKYFYLEKTTYISVIGIWF